MSDLIKELTWNEVSSFLEKSRTNERGRKPTPLTPGDFEDFQTLVNPIQPGSYIRPHRHDYGEVWMGIKGRVILGLFDENGNPSEAVNLSRGGVLYHHVPGNVYHFGFADEPDSIFFNISRGPFDPNAAKGFAPWSPAEDSESARRYLSKVVESFRELL